MSATNGNADISSMFGLTEKQAKILFSIERLLVLNDIIYSKDNKMLKQKWLSEWSASVIDCLTKDPQNPVKFMTRGEILSAIALENSTDANNTWYYLIMFEATLFIPYYVLNKNKKEYDKLKYKEQTDTIKDMVRASAIMDEVFIDRFKKTYSVTISKLKGTKIPLYIVSTLAIAAIVAATAGTLSGPIAVALYASQFPGLSGAALTSACLAIAGGGAIAAGGAGMAGGVLTIVGGGALIGLAIGGAGVGAAAKFIATSPEFALTQAAKLEVVLKEIILNAQKDIMCAQKVLENYKNQIAYLHSELAKIKLEHGEDKEIIKNMKESLDLMEKSYKNIIDLLKKYEVDAEFKDRENGDDDEKKPTNSN